MKEKESRSDAIRYCPVKEAFVRVELGVGGVVVRVPREPRFVDGRVVVAECSCEGECELKAGGSIVEN